MPFGHDCAQTSYLTVPGRGGKAGKRSVSKVRLVGRSLGLACLSAWAASPSVRAVT